MARTRPPALQGGGRGADRPPWKTVRGPVVGCGCPSPCPSSFTLGTCLGDTWATDGHENSRPAPPSRVLAPRPLATSKQHPHSSTRKGQSKEAEPSGRGRRQPPGCRRPWCSGAFGGQGLEDHRDICLPSVCGLGAGLGQGVCRQRQRLKRAEWPVEGSRGPGSLAHSSPQRDRRSC